MSEILYLRYSLVPSPRVPLGEKWSGEQSQISWAYTPKVVRTNEIVRLAYIALFFTTVNLFFIGTRTFFEQVWFKMF